MQSLHASTLAGLRLICLGTALSALVCASAVAAPVVKTPSGALRGTDQGQSSVYFGIPFAKPPVGDLRWRDPVPAGSWNGERDATKPAKACWQGEAGSWGPFTPEFTDVGERSEDCLYLNVWVPKQRSGKLPVFFWIHGGGYGSGSGTLPVYNGANLAARGAVVVTINYRVGVFGFLAHPELTAESRLKTSGNYGILDMIEALRWVHANIAAFGGDPASVTIAGQSAGAGAVNELTLSPLARGLFHRAIAQSGSGLGTFRDWRLKEAEQYGAQLATSLKAKSIADLRRIDAEQLQRITNVPPPVTGTTLKTPTISFAPNRDEVVIVGASGDPATPRASPVPFLTGFNIDEGAAFSPGENTSAAFERDMLERYGKVGPRLVALYSHAQANQVEAARFLLARDRFMTSAVLWARGRGEAGVPTYVYLYDHPYPGANGQPSFGAFHTAEVPYVFGALGLGPRQFTDKDRAVARQFQDHWLAFMRTGDPSLPKMPWKPVSRDSGATVMGLGDTYGPRPAVSSPERFEAFKEYAQSGGLMSVF